MDYSYRCLKLEPILVTLLRKVNGYIQSVETEMAVRSRGTIRLARILVVLTAIIATTLSAQEPASRTAGMEGWPEWLVEAMKREGPPYEALPVSVPTRNLTSQLYGKALGELEAIDLGWYVTADIETTTSMECWIFTSPVDRAATVQNIAQINMDASANINGAIAEQFIFSQDAGMIGRSPYIALEMVYAMGEDANRKVGFVKVSIAGRDGVNLACSHNQIGYRETFARGFAHFVQSASFDPSEVQPFLRQVYRPYLDGTPIGIIESTYSIDGDGDLVLRSIDSTLMPSGGSTVEPTDNYEISYWTPEGGLINQISIVSVAGEVVSNVDLRSAGGNNFLVSGIYLGNELELQFSDSDPPVSDAAIRLETQRMMADPERDSLVVNVWRATLDPTRLFEATLTLDPERRDELLGELMIGPVNMDVQLDEFGQIKNGVTTVGASSLQVERIFKEGQSPRLTGDN